MTDSTPPPLNAYGVPASLDDWTYGTILALVRGFQFEPDFFDFKGVLNPKGSANQHNKMIRKAAASFANADGGYLVFGVADRADGTYVSPEDRIVGIPTQSDVQKEFQNKVDAIEPPIRFHPSPLIAIPTTPDRAVLVVHVPRSASGPHLADDTFWVRGAGGSARPMSYWGISRAFGVTHQRRQQIALLTELLRSIRGQLKRMRGAKSLMLASERFDTALLGSSIAHVLDPDRPSPVGADLLMIKSSAERINGVLDRHQLHGAGNPAWADHQFALAETDLLAALDASEDVLAQLLRGD